MELTNIGNVRTLCEKHGFSFTKSLGQNFLINPSVCPRMAELAGSGREVCALEIGAGFGVLTKELASRCSKVVAIEIDSSLKPVLDETLADLDNTEIIFGDVMDLDLKKILSEKFGKHETIICANLPYYITSPVIMRLLEEQLPVRAVTVMVQKEAALRICAKPGTRDSSALTIAVNYYSQPEKLFNVSRGSFMPAPDVDSAVIRLNIRKDNGLGVSDPEIFFRVSRAVFAQRRKQIINPLSAALNIPKEELSEILTGIGISPSSRAEQLTMKDFAAISSALNYKL